jgi:hypothetical protein
LEDVSLWDAARLYNPKRRGPWGQRRFQAIICVHPKLKLTFNDSENEQYYTSSKSFSMFLGAINQMLKVNLENN